MMKTNRRKNISALQLRSLAGRAPHERGSALLIVIGTLALVAVFAAVYVSIGRTDRRAAQTFRNRVEQQDKSFQFAEYLSGIIGDDRLDAYVQYDINGNPFARREVVDVVYTDWSRRSEVNLGVNSEEALLFTPTGRPYRMEGLTATTDFRVQNDPWLAATTPTFLGDPGEPDNAFAGGDLRPFGKLLPFDDKRPNAGSYLDQRDWLQISNFAPDGRPVNLFNLRPTLPDGNYRAIGGSNTAVGGFDAEPGFGTSPRASDGRPIRRMSNFLSLLNVQDQGDAQTFLHAFDPASPVSAGNPAGGGVWVQGYNDPQDIGITGTDLYNIPAVWTMNQRFMFMPMNQPFVILNRLGQESSWADPDYPAYQYADADGDGFADSRWFELRSARDLGAGGAFGSARDDIQDLFEQGEMRYFFAARAIDLSSMVNINTATDGLVTPNGEYPMGSSPAEIDLRRLLTMQDPAENYVAMTSITGPNFLPLSLNAAPRPYAENATIATPRPWDLATRPEEDFRRAPEDYQFYQADLANSPSNPNPNDIREPMANSPSMLIGRYAYSALRRAIRVGGTPGNQFRGVDPLSGGSASGARDLIQFETTDPNTPTSPLITAQQRYDQYLAVGRQYSANPGLVTSSAGLFGIDDLSELLTFHGLNDPDFTSRLERVVDGRYESGTGDPIQTRRMSPLLSNRDLTLDRFGHTRILSTVDMRTAPYLDNLTDLTRIGEISRNSMALMALTPRKRMTTLSGFVPLSPDERLTDASDMEALNTTTLLPTLENLMQDPQALFSLYSGALAGELEDLFGFGAWQIDPTQFATQNYSTLFYGHRGPELALRVAAHTAVNMKDIADEDGEPTIATLITHSTQTPDDLQNFATTQPGMNENPESSDPYQLFPGIVEGNLFDAIGEGYASNLPEGRQAVNVYGIEAMPVITEVSMLYAFTDAPESEGGDPDSEMAIPTVSTFGPPRVIYPPREDVLEVTINTDVDRSNSDYLMQVLAIQLHNPYDQPISLGGRRKDNSFIANSAPLTRQYNDELGSVDTTEIDTSSNYQFDYYLEYGGRFFKVAEYIEYYPDFSVPGSFDSFDDPASNVAYSTVPNPFTGIGAGGGKMPVTNATSGPRYKDFITRNVILGPNETRVFYAIADQRFDENRPGTVTNDFSPDDRWTRYLTAYGDLPISFTNRDDDGDGLADGRDKRGWTGPAEEWVNHQLTVYSDNGHTNTNGDRANRPVMMMSFDPTNGELFDMENGFELLNQPPVINPLGFDSSREDFSEVRLWKKIVTDGEETANRTANPRATRRNLIENDLLVDRMAVGDLSSDWAGGNVAIPDSWSFREDIPIPGTPLAAFEVRNDNSGITIADWVTVRRADSASQQRPSTGQVTPWMLRVTNGGVSTEVENRMLDHMDAMDIANTQSLFVDGGPIDDPDVIPEFLPDYEIASTLREFVDYARTNGEKAIIQTIALDPHGKSNVEVPYTGAVIVEDDGPNRSLEKFQPNIISGVTNFTNLDPTTGLPVPEILVGSDLIRERPRLTDLLLAWGIGPTYAPDPTRAATTRTGFYDPDEWMTTSEAMAIALGIDSFTTLSDNTAADAVWFESFDTTTDPTNPMHVLSDGRLSLDQFVTFRNQDFTESPIFFNPTVDRIRGSGVPAALGVLDRARVFEPLGRVTDPVANPPATLGLTRPMFGTININTAPVEVLRLLPGLTPSRAQYSNTNAGAGLAYEWWGNRLTDSEASDTSTLAVFSGGESPSLLKNPDVAAGIVAYRDRVMAAPITGAHATAAGGQYFFSPLNPSVNDQNIGSVANNFLMEDPSLFTAPRKKLDRRTMSGIEGLRMTPGFGSVGELLAVRVDPDFETDTTSFTWDNIRNLTMNLYGTDGIAQGIQDNATVVPQIFDGTGLNSVGNTVDDYAEQLAMASGVLNMVSVRSDYYAVWFVIQGYRESDVANLRPEDPLVPTLQKRFMMVVDRSNVIEPGDKPRIVLLKEVPL